MNRTLGGLNTPGFAHAEVALHERASRLVPDLRGLKSGLMRGDGVATGGAGNHFRQNHRSPGAHPLARRRISAPPAPRRSRVRPDARGVQEWTVLSSEGGAGITGAGCGTLSRGRSVRRARRASRALEHAVDQGSNHPAGKCGARERPIIADGAGFRAPEMLFEAGLGDVLGGGQLTDAPPPCLLGPMATLRESIEAYVKRVKELAEHVRGNEQATKQSLIGPFFTMLGYDLTDPRECVPEYKVDFGKDRSTKPIDWGFKHTGAFAFFVEAKEVGRKLAGFDEQLADYFAKEPNVKLGILTNGAQWRFFTDVVNANVMDREPFAKWDILADEPPPYDVITLLQKAQFNAELIRTFAQRQHAQNLLVQELTRLLEPSTEFAKLAVANIETRNLTQAVVESWKPIVANAIQEWAKQRTLTAVLLAPAPVSSKEVADTAGKIETTQEELDSFEIVRKVLGLDKPVGYEDSVAYFKVHVFEKRTWVCARLQMNRKHPLVWVPLPADQVAQLAPGRPVQSSGSWTSVSLDEAGQIVDLGELLRTAYAAVRHAKAGGPLDATPGGVAD